jgi:uncharacterized membrane protein
VTDLARVAANPEIVIPSSPEESELWTLVSRGEMPPSDSPHGPLLEEQKELIRSWIKSSAPHPSTPEKAPATAESVEISREPSVAAATEPKTLYRLLTWIGKFHLLMIHFPIALVLAAVTAELLSIWRKIPALTSAGRFCVSLAEMVAAPTAALGWLFAGTSFSETPSPLLTAHRWLGTTTAALLVITGLCAAREARRGIKTRRVRLLLLLAALATAMTAHLGGLMAHGSDFFAF